MKITSAKYITSAVNREGMIGDSLPQIAVAGRSNVGKSSFINFITDNGKLCRTSSEPGRTRMVNYFLINNAFYLVDLPGYGYAAAGRNEINKWADFINAYLTDNPVLTCVLVLLDIRREPSEQDMQLINYLTALRLPFIAIATKADKVSRAEAGRMKSLLAAGLKMGADSIYAVSATAKTGKDEVLNRISEILASFND